MNYLVPLFIVFLVTTHHANALAESTGTNASMENPFVKDCEAARAMFPDFSQGSQDIYTTRVVWHTEYGCFLEINFFDGQKLLKTIDTRISQKLSPVSVLITHPDSTQTRVPLWLQVPTVMHPLVIGPTADVLSTLPSFKECSKVRSQFDNVQGIKFAVAYPSAEPTLHPVCFVKITFTDAAHLRKFINDRLGMTNPDKVQFIKPNTVESYVPLWISIAGEP